MGAADLDRAGPDGRHLTEPGWYPDPWHPGGFRWHDGTTWTSWTGPPPMPPYGAAPLATVADVESERRLRPVAQLAIVGWGVLSAAGGIGFAIVIRDLFEPLIDLFGTTNATDAEVRAAIDEVQVRQADEWWLNVASLLPLACMAAMAVWSNRVATVARGLRYPARHSPGWAAAGWFVPVVNLWFPYQSIVDSISPMNLRRGRVLRWWLLYTVGGVVLGVLVLLVVFDAVSPAVVAAPMAGVGLLQVIFGLQVVDLVHEDHARAVSSSR